MVITDLNYKHWDRYVTTIPHIFVADVQDGRTGDGIDLLNGEPFECPMLPFGGSEQFNWSPDSRYIVYTSRKRQAGTTLSVRTATSTATIRRPDKPRTYANRPTTKSLKSTRRVPWNTKS